MEVDMIKTSEKCFECQKVTVLVDTFQDCPVAYKKKDVYLDWNLVGRVALGDYVDMVCYYEMEPTLQCAKEGQAAQVIMTEVFACESLECSSSNNNAHLLLRDSYEMVKSRPACVKGLELDHLYSDFHSVIKAVNTFEFSISKKDKLTALKLAVASSILLNGTNLDWQIRGK
jgi:hypothetical protein